MHYTRQNEEIDATVENNIPVANPTLFTEKSQIKQTRIICIILNGVLLGLCIGGLMILLFQSTASHYTVGSEEGALCGSLIIAILYYGFGILVAYKYHRTGLRVYAILGVISLVPFSIVIVGLLFLGGIFLSNSGYGHMEALAMVAGLSFLCIGIACIVPFIVTIIGVKLAFKLVRLLDCRRFSNGQPI